MWVVRELGMSLASGFKILMVCVRFEGVSIVDE